MTTPKLLTLTKLDYRHNGKSMFDYRVQILGDRQQRFRNYSNIRQWCWETFGPSNELDIAISLRPTDGQPTAWAFQFGKEFQDNYIYLRSDKELALFKLKWM